MSVGLAPSEGQEENLFQVSLLASGEFLATFANHPNRYLHFHMAFAQGVCLCVQIRPFCKNTVVLSQGLPNNLMIT